MLGPLLPLMVIWVSNLPTVKYSRGREGVGKTNRGNKVHAYIS